MKLVLLFMAALLSCASLAAAQSPPPAPPDSVAAQPLRLFLDSPDATMDMDFLRREMPWVDWVRDRADADVYVLLTGRATGSGGTEATFYLTRLHGDGPPADTLRVFTPPSTSDDTIRRIVARTLSAALARDLLARPEGEHMKLVVAPPPNAAPPAPARDRWDHWVYKVATQGSLNGESSYRNGYLYNSLSASRVVETHKMGASLSQNLSENRYNFDDGSYLITTTRSLNARVAGAMSLGQRWSWGGSSSYYTSSYSNIASSVRIGPSIEYDLFPYGESSRRSLTLAYQLNVSHTRYEEITLYGKMNETLFMNEFDAGLSLRQPWGSVDLYSSLYQYLHDTSKYQLTSSLSTNIKVWRGLSLETSLWGARIHNQLSLRRGTASDTDVITRQRQLATSYNYYLSFGLSYRFGSLSNNVVNQRLDNTLGSF